MAERMRGSLGSLLLEGSPLMTYASPKGPTFNTIIILGSLNFNIEILEEYKQFIRTILLLTSIIILNCDCRFMGQSAHLERPRVTTWREVENKASTVSLERTGD